MSGSTQKSGTAAGQKTGTAAEEQNGRGRRKEEVGIVIADKMMKTITVQTFRSVMHPKYKKFMKKTSVFKAHDEKNEAKVGDKVRIFEARPLSKTKRWKLAEIVEKVARDQEQK